ncbi:MAG: hypothetical protein ACXVDB_07825 [Tumebacillaceae bacterium]
MDHVKEPLHAAEAHVKQTLNVTPETVNRLHDRVMRQIHVQKKSARSKWIKFSVAAVAAVVAMTVAIPQLSHVLNDPNQPSQPNKVVSGAVPADVHEPSFSDVYLTNSDGTIRHEINAKDVGFEKALAIVKKQAGFDLYLPEVKKLNMSSVQYIENLSKPKNNLVDFNYYLVGDQQLIDLTVWFSEAAATTQSLDDVKNAPGVQPVQINNATWYKVKEKLDPPPTGAPAVSFLTYKGNLGTTTVKLRFPETFKDPEGFITSFKRVNGQ